MVPLQTGPAGRAVILTAGARNGFTLMTIGFEFATNVVTQIELEVSMHVITSRLFNVEEEKVVLFIPTFTPFSCHWYCGDEPPKTGIVVNVTVVPVQIGPAGLALMLMAGAGGIGLTLTVIE